MTTNMGPAQQLEHIRGRALQYLERIESASRTSLTPAIVAREMAVLRNVIAIAELGLLASSAASQQRTLEKIDHVCGVWLGCGFSQEFVKASAIENLAALEAPSTARN